METHMRLFPLALFAGLVACSGGSTDKSSDTGPTTGPSTGSTPTGGTYGGTTDPDRNARMSGTIRDCGGAPLADAQIRFCDPTICRNQTTGGDGAYDYTNSLIGWNSFEVFGPEGSDLATAFVPVELGDADDRSLDLTLCPHGPYNTLSGAATEFPHGDHLMITVSTTLLEKPTPFDDDATVSAGLLVDPAHHVPIDGISGTVAAQWYLEPFNYKSADAGGLDYRVDGATLGLAAASYHVYVGSYDDFAWLDAGTISDADADGFYTPDAEGLPLMGTVVLVEE